MQGEAHLRRPDLVRLRRCGDEKQQRKQPPHGRPSAGGASNVSDAQRLSHSAFEPRGASIICTDLISHTPARGSATNDGLLAYAITAAARPLAVNHPAGSALSAPLISSSCLPCFTTNRSIYVETLGTGSPTKFWPTRSPSDTVIPGAGWKVDGSIQKSCACSAAAKSSATGRDEKCFTPLPYASRRACRASTRTNSTGRR